MEEPLMPRPGWCWRMPRSANSSSFARMFPGVSTAALAREALRLADDPAMAAQYPREVRAVRERRDRMREARSARLLTVRCEV